MKEATRIIISFCFLILILVSSTRLKAQNQYPNILLIISDDLGTDVSNGYFQNNPMPTTPTLDSLRSVGITFSNAWAYPVCAPTRAAILSGKYGVKTGATELPASLDTTDVSIFRALASQTNDTYADALIGKWHLRTNPDQFEPIDHGADHFDGLLGGGVQDYYSWEHTLNDSTGIDTTYTTEAITNGAIDWIQQQNTPWFGWLAYNAPHTPTHVPPAGTFNINNTTPNFRKYIAAIEALDFYLTDLFASMSDSVRDNTLVIYIGDNGTPGNFLRDYPTGHGKGSLYEGGIRVPMVVSGRGVSRAGERESAMVHVLDIYATILEAAGAELPGGIYNSLSFHHLLDGSPGETRDYNYSETTNDGDSLFGIRGPQYKLIEFITDNRQEMYDLLADSLETNDLLLGTLTAEQDSIKQDMEAEAAQIRSSWSCRDHIQNGDEAGIDCGGSECANCITTALEDELEESSIKIFPNPFTDRLTIVSEEHLMEEVRVFDALGKMIWEKKAIHQHQLELNLPAKAGQLFFMDIRSNGQRDMRRLIRLAN
ncbi:MAG: sulfatase-like hydrolase/transferase [Bacteroidota bacterium]